MTEEEEEEEGRRRCVPLSRAAQDPCHSYEVGKPQWGPALTETPGEIWVLVASMGMLLKPGFACGGVCRGSRAGDSECYKSDMLQRGLAGPDHSAVAKRERSLAKLDSGQREEPGFGIKLGMLTRPVQVHWAWARGRGDMKRLEGAVPPSESPHSP